ncbi:MAG: hypothetical protein K9H26_16080 [Prolixibacteraceae bacterium]|nr:hypothetical protein [Prolixibacteraceae bacterium]
MKGNVESISNYVVKGWCFDKNKPAESVKVSIFISGNEVANGLADHLRPGLKNKVHPTGKCGFKIALPKQLEYNGQSFEVRANKQIFQTRFKAFLDETGNETINRIQLYGERASGTNYLIQLLLKNIPNILHTSQYGWKHFFPPNTFPNSDRCLFLVIYRDPFDWIRSLYLQPHHVHPSLKNISFSDFIRSEWQCVYDELANVFPGDEKYGKEMMFERNPKNGKRFENVIKLRNAKIRAFETLRNKVKHIEYIRYEDLANEPEKFVNMLAQKYDLHAIRPFENITTYKGITPRAYRPKTYKDFSEDDLKFILLNIDIAIEKKIGYSSSFSGKIMSPYKLWIEKRNYAVRRLYFSIMKLF